MKTALILLILALFAMAVTSLQVAGILPTPEFDYAAWDVVATLGWSLLPCILCMVLVQLVRILNSLTPLYAAELKARAAKHDAEMWLARDTGKQYRKGNHA